MHVGNCDGININDVAIIGAMVGVDCTVIIIMVITNIMVWIYCIRRMDYKGGTMVLVKLASYLCSITTNINY